MANQFASFLAATAQVPQPWFAEADAAGWGERDYSAVLARIIGPR